jgi:hypothetical protein
MMMVRPGSRVSLTLTAWSLIDDDAAEWLHDTATVEKNTIAVALVVVTVRSNLANSTVDLKIESD